MKAYLEINISEPLKSLPKIKERMIKKIEKDIREAKKEGFEPGEYRIEEELYIAAPKWNPDYPEISLGDQPWYLYYDFIVHDEEGFEYDTFRWEKGKWVIREDPEGPRFILKKKPLTKIVLNLKS